MTTSSVVLGKPTRSVRKLNNFPEKKRIRMNFGKQFASMDPPYLLAMQRDSYDRFLQLNTTPEQLKNQGLHSAFQSIFPIKGYGERDACLEYVSYRIGAPPFNVKECQSRSLTYGAPLRIKLRLV